MKNTLELLNKISNTVYEREPNNDAYVDEDDPSTYFIEYKVHGLCETELTELSKQMELWEEIKRIALLNKYIIDKNIKYITMQIPLNDNTIKLFSEEEDNDEEED